MHHFSVELCLSQILWFETSASEMVPFQLCISASWSSDRHLNSESLHTKQNYFCCVLVHLFSPVPDDLP